MISQTCSNCGAAAGPEERFCRSCGTTFTNAGYGQQQAQGGYQQPGYAYSPAMGGPMLPQEQLTGAGFFNALFDLSFSNFVTTKLIKVLYVLSMIGAGLAALFLLVGGFLQGGASIVVGVILAPLVFLIYVILARVWMELIIVMFRIAEHTRDIARNTRK